MRLTYERQAALQSRARRLGAVATRCTEVAGGYAGGVALYCREPIPLWDVTITATGGFLILISYLLMQLRCGALPVPGARDRTRTLLDSVSGWPRLDGVPIAGCDDVQVGATPAGLLVLVATHEADLALVAAAARRVHRMTTAAPNPLDVPVYGALLVPGPGNDAVRQGWDEAAGVYVLGADQPWSWPAELTNAAAPDSDVRPEQIYEALRKVSGWSANHERRLTLPRLTMILLAEMRRGLRERRIGELATA